MVDTAFEKIEIISSAFEHNGFIPQRYTGRGEDISPSLEIIGLSPDCQSLAIVMNDLDVPFIGTYNHWLIWQIPAQDHIPENIPHGVSVESLNGAIQGIGYGKHRYRGPKPPSFIKKPHRYQFHVYALDCQIELDNDAKRKKLLQAMDGHVIQYGSITGLYQNDR